MATREKNADSSRCGSRGGIVLVLLVALGLLVLLFALYTLFTLHWSYLEGERAGILQKFSRKGWVFKTYLPTYLPTRGNSRCPLCPA